MTKQKLLKLIDKLIYLNPQYREYDYDVFEYKDGDYYIAYLYDRFSWGDMRVEFKSKDDKTYPDFSLKELKELFDKNLGL